MSGGTRIGMLTPSSNSALEPETYRMLTGLPEVSAHFARIPVTHIDLGAAATAQFDRATMAQACALLADARVDVVAWNGTSGSWLGPDRDRELAAALTEIAGVPATTSTLALLSAFRAVGVRRLGLATPYTDPVVGAIAAQYARHGVTVACETHLNITDNEAFARVGPGELDRLIRGAATEQVDAVAVVCTNLHGAPLAAKLEAELGIPVLDSVTVTLWHALMLADADRPVAGFGSLLLSGGLRFRLTDIAERLLGATGAARVTVRLDVPELGLSVDRPGAESARAGVPPLGADLVVDQRALDTVAWIAEHRRPLVQPDFSGPLSPPDVLRTGYGVRAQMLGPVLRREALAGWLSVHSGHQREWSTSDLAALDEAVTATRDELDRIDRVGGLAGYPD